MLATIQKSLFDVNPTIFEIKKHSALAQMNNVTNLMQRKAINAFLTIAKDQLKRTPDAIEFEVDLGVLKALAGIQVSNNTKLKNNLKALASLVIEYNILHKDEYERGAFAFLSEIMITRPKKGKTTKVRFMLARRILASLANPSMYVKLNLLLQR